MPIKTFKCMDCYAHFDLLIPNEELKCFTCGSTFIKEEVALVAKRNPAHGIQK